MCRMCCANADGSVSRRFPVIKKKGREMQKIAVQNPLLQILLQKAQPSRDWGASRLLGFFSSFFFKSLRT